MLATPLTRSGFWLTQPDQIVALCNRSQISEACRWEAPPTSMYKVNVVIRNSKGEPIAELCKLLPRQFSSLEIEIIALENGILLAKEMELT